ncbi:MAG: ATP-binding protein [Fervidicoccus fontis]|nr:MAG: ATP-binding protein [Fervidicoccus fontis]
MAEIAVEIKGLYKEFRVYHDRAMSMKERIVNWGRHKYEKFWALKNINLEVKKGESLGIVGRNGSGKSTLLKVISGIYYPTKGEVRVNGKLTTLLELGAGFHPDFTGRENIYFNASIFGFTRKEINAKLDEIIAFSELGEFIDNPVRNYSSGMYMRLAFSVAIHIEPEILLLDEVLAVGDSAFQEKCMSKIESFREKGVTMIFVSHASLQVEKLCDRAVWLKDGEIEKYDDAKSVVRAYERWMDTR